MRARDGCIAVRKPQFTSGHGADARALLTAYAAHPSPDVAAAPKALLAKRGL